MSIHEDALDLIQYFTGCQNEAYACPSHISNGGQWPHLSIGYGHSGPSIHHSTKVSTTQAKELLARDLSNVETYVRNKVKIPLQEYQLGALIALAYNVKTMLDSSEVFNLLNKGEFGRFDVPSSMEENLGPRITGMAYHWASFRRVNGRVLPILVKRRTAELELFFTGTWSVPGSDRIPQKLDEPQEMDALRPGARAPIISDLHEALAHVGFPVTCGDAYTWVTEEAVRAFQLANGLTADGIYGPETARKLSEVVNG